MRDLIVRIEAATGPDRELDIAIARATGWRFLDCDRAWRPEHVLGCRRKKLSIWRHEPICIPSFTAGIDAALTLVPEGRWWEVGRSAGDTSPLRHYGGRRGCFSANVAGWGDEPNVLTAATPALALCAAALRARLAMQENADAPE